MEHTVEITETMHELPDVPTALHMRCSCGWSSSAHSREDADQFVREHIDSGVVPAPPPYVPSPD
ncbi:MAG: hypothetical protein JWM86_2077 [Thermoleophilia bacterium]|nr:hypothetical protein [Thermoleophilia bacterium]